MKWLIEDKLCSFDEQVRVEIGPQIIKLPCTEANLSNEVTHANYQNGKPDAYGNIIDTKTMDEMNCVDWRSKHAPHVWKVYQMQDDRFIKVDEYENKDEALAFAEALYEEMQ